LNATALIWFLPSAKFFVQRRLSQYDVIRVRQSAVYVAEYQFDNVFCAAEKRGVANGIRMTLNMTGGVFSVPFSLLLMSLVMPYNQLSQVVGSTQLLSVMNCLHS